jgi:hypothetical protein
MRLHEFEEMLGEQIEDPAREEVTTLGGLIMTKLDRLPYVSDEIRVAAGVYASSSSLAGASESRGSFHQTGLTLPAAQAPHDGQCVAAWRPTRRCCAYDQPRDLRAGVVVLFELLTEPRTAYFFMIGVLSSDAFAFTVRHPSEPRQSTVRDASVPDGHSHAIVRPCSSWRVGGPYKDSILVRTSVWRSRATYMT